MLIDDIVDHRANEREAIHIDDAFTITKSGQKRRKKTIKGWSLLFQWKDGTTTWVKLKDLKNSCSIDTAIYARDSRLLKQPALAWWASYMLRKMKRVIVKVKSAYWDTSHKFGIKLPKFVAEALELDERNHNTKWRDSIRKETDNVCVAFDVWDREEKDIPIRYQKIGCHMVFDIKISKKFRCGHTSDTPSTLTYSSVVFRDSVRIELLFAALSDLKVSTCDIQNAYLTAPYSEKIYTIAGPELGSEEGSIMIVKRALYGLKSSGAAFRLFLASIIYDIGNKSKRGDPNMWILPAVKQNGFAYYKYLKTYVDDVICVSEAPELTMKGFMEQVKLKNDFVGPPESFISA